MIDEVIHNDNLAEGIHSHYNYFEISAHYNDFPVHIRDELFSMDCHGFKVKEDSGNF